MLLDYLKYIDTYKYTYSIFNVEGNVTKTSVKSIINKCFDRVKSLMSIAYCLMTSILCTVVSAHGPIQCYFILILNNVTGALVVL